MNYKLLLKYSTCEDLTNVTVWRQERAHTSDNHDNSVATGYRSNNDGFGISWLRDPEKPIWI